MLSTYTNTNTYTNGQNTTPVFKTVTAAELE